MSQLSPKWHKKSLLSLMVIALVGCSSVSKDPKVPANTDYMTEALPPMVPTEDTNMGMSGFNQPMPNFHENAPKSYIVKRGDTLWGISGKFLSNPWRWRAIWKNNPQISNPHLIYPGDRITQTWSNGKMGLSIDRADGSGREVYSAESRYVRLQPKIRYSTLNPIPIVSQEMLEQFADKPNIISEEALNESGYILGNADDLLVYTTDTRAYARGLEKYSPGKRISIYRTGDMLLDPVTKENLGRESTLVGTAVIEESGKTSVIRIDDSYREVLRGDRLLLSTLDSDLSQLETTIPSHDFEGKVIAAFDGFSRMGENQVISINLGKRDNMSPGNVLAVRGAHKPIYDKFNRDAKQKPEWVEVPDRENGVVMIFRTFEKMSYALIMNSDRPIRKFDKITNIEN